MIKQVSTIRAAGASLLFVAVFAAVIAASAAARAQNLRPGGRRTALDEYIAAADDVYKWQVAHRTKNGLLDTTVIELTSQSWRGSDDVGRSVWKHWVTVVRPKAARADTALLYIGGGRNGKSHPTSADKMLTAVAIATNSVVIELKMVPNQPLEFHGDGKGRYEDDLIAYAWGKYLETGEATWLPRLPMVKSAVRAMDCVQEYLAGEEGGGLKVNQFVVAGGSKRGWTTWLTGAVDKRVVAIAPIVIDVLNVKVSMDHHYAAYGFWAPAIGDYVNHKITHRRNHPRYDDLLSIVDPLRYRDRLTIPKCIINATGDEFFLPDSSRFYFDELRGEKHLCYVPNANHSLKGTKAIETLIAFHRSIVENQERPEYEWKFVDDGGIRVTTKTSAQRVLLWQANNPAARDFRIMSIGRAYQSSELEMDERGVYYGRVEKPAKGWTAFFIQIEYAAGASTTMRVTSGVRVTPDTLPFSEKQAPLSD